jgi:hypothetical protein
MLASVVTVHNGQVVASDPLAPAAPWTASSIVQPVRVALESGNLKQFGALLSPNVTWGAPGSANPPCRNRQQVLIWYSRGRSAGSRASVVELSVSGDRLLVGLDVAQDGGRFERWQVLTVDGAGICDIRGHESRASAAAAWQVPSV